MSTTATPQIDNSAEQNGRETIIADYCRARLQQGHRGCVVLCLKRGRRFCAVDIPVKPNDPTVGLDRLRKESGRWWKQYSLYSVIAVKEINVRLMEVDQPANGPPQIRVSILHIDYNDDISQLDRAIDIELGECLRPMECGVNVNGESHDESCYFDCPNAGFDDLDGFYCKVNRVRILSQQRLDYRWLPSMLEYYWQNGVDKKGLAFLRGVGFVHSYRDLQYDKFCDTTSPYGRPIAAFLLVEGWHIRYLLILIGFGLLGSVCIIAVTAALTQSMDIALTAGSYACALAGCLIAVFTFLSAVL